MEKEAIIRTEGLSKYYKRQVAVDNLTMRVEEGEIFGFLGPNGAGKTTTLLMLTGLSQPTRGTARVGGMDPLRNAREVKRLVGYLPENVGFYGDLDAVQSLEYVASLNGMTRAETVRKIPELLHLVELTKDARKKVAAFSRGMKQRLGIAEVLIKNPEILFLDEPTLGIDPEGAIRLVSLIETLNRERKITVVLSSHQLQQVQKISSRVGIMIGGKLVAQGTVSDLAKDRFGVGDTQYSLEEIYMKHFQEG